MPALLSFVVCVYYFLVKVGLLSRLQSSLRNRLELICPSISRFKCAYFHLGMRGCALSSFQIETDLAVRIAVDNFLCISLLGVVWVGYKSSRVFPSLLTWMSELRSFAICVRCNLGFGRPRMPS